MPSPCEYLRGCERPGLYTIPTDEKIPLSIRVCASHRALWVQELRRRSRWPCAVDGCPRVAVQDGLCEHCWVVVRAHDDLVTGECEPSLRRLAVRHIARPIVAEVPTQGEIDGATKMVETLRGLVRSCAALTGRAPMELRDDLEEATRLLSEVTRHAALLSQVQLQEQADQPRQQRFL